MNSITEPEILALIESRIIRYGSAKKAAVYYGISQQYLHDIRTGRRGLSDRILEKMKIKRTVVYRWNP